MMKTVLTGTVLALALATGASAIATDASAQTYRAWQHYRQNDPVPPALNGQSGGSPNNQRIGPTDRAGNTPSDNR